MKILGVLESSGVPGGRSFWAPEAHQAMHGLCRGYVANLLGKRSEYRGAGAGGTCSLLRKRKESEERKEQEDIEEREERTNMNARRRRSLRAWLRRRTTNSTYIEREHA